MQAIARASTLGEIDYHANRPSNESDEQFLATVGEILAEWAREHGQFGPAITIVGQRWDAESQSLGDILQRWGAPLRFLEAASPEGRPFLAEHGIGAQLPLVVLPDGRTLMRPSVSEVAEAFGANAEPLSTSFDLAVLGSGPAGLSTALNAAAEGLKVVLVEPSIGQASSSPMIRNYLGFPAGLSGAELVRRAWQQAWMFGVQARMGRAAQGIRAEGDERIVALDDGSEAHARAIVLATGVAYRRLGIPSVEGLAGRGVFYDAGATEAQAMAGEPVAVVGGGNSAAQAAVHLARYARSVSLLVREGSLAGSISEYLLEQLGALPNVDVRLETEVLGARDAHRLQTLVLRDKVTGTVIEREATALFILIGSAPRTDWLPTDIARDEQGFVLTGDDAPPAAEPGTVRLSLETTMPGVFAVGDVRHGSIKRVAVAVGEGATASQQVQRYRSGLADRTGDLDEPTEPGRLAGTAAAHPSHEQVTR
jgi:thioredoxin reductase (NADPH)